MKVNQIIQQQLQKAYVWQFVKFVLVGISNAIVLLAVYYTLLFLGIHYIPAYIVGFALSVLNAYFWNNQFVFKNSHSSFWKKLSKVYVSYITTFLLSMVLLYLWVDVIHLSDKIAPIINICITTPVNFLMNKLWAFKK